MTASERRAAGAETMRARRASVQADRRIAGAILRGAGGSRAMAAARARHQAEARRDEAEHLAAHNPTAAADLDALPIIREVGDTCSGEADWPERATLADRRAAMFEAAS